MECPEGKLAYAPVPSKGTKLKAFALAADERTAAAGDPFQQFANSERHRDRKQQKLQL